MVLEGFATGPLAANCYLVSVDEGRDCVVIDPGHNAMVPLVGALDSHGLRPVAALVTHGHFDHVGGLRSVCRTFNMPCYLGARDEFMLTDQRSALSDELAESVRNLPGGGGLDAMRPDSVTVIDSSTAALDLAGLHIEVLAVPGHTPGSVAYFIERAAPEPPVVFTGDTLFAGSIGRTDLPGGSSLEILSSIRSRLLSLPDDTVVLPGHGGASTIGTERVTNPFLAGLTG